MRELSYSKAKTINCKKKTNMHHRLNKYESCYTLKIKQSLYRNKRGPVFIHPHKKEGSLLVSIERKKMPPEALYDFD